MHCTTLKYFNLSFNYFLFTWPILKVDPILMIFVKMSFKLCVSHYICTNSIKHGHVYERKNFFQKSWATSTRYPSLIIVKVNVKCFWVRHQQQYLGWDLNRDTCKHSRLQPLNSANTRRCNQWTVGAIGWSKNSKSFATIFF